MSNIAGKSYAMSVITPLPPNTAWMTRLLFWGVGHFFASKLKGLQTLSLIHYARWVVITPDQFPQLSPKQPKEDLRYSYMLFHSNFNGSWDQYVDSFSSSISVGLDTFWARSIKYPKSVPMLPFHRYITSNQIWNDHYYNAYPMAASNDIKSAKRVRDSLLEFTGAVAGVDAATFERKYNALLYNLQHDLSQMGPNPIVSLSAWAVEDRLNRERKTVELSHGAGG